MIGVIDYGLGNVSAFLNIYRRLGIPARSVKTVDELEGVDRLILPGVGAFDWAMTRFEASGMKEAVSLLVVEQQMPILGVCVGMQMMARGSDEGMLPGLAWLDADVRHFGSQSEAGSMILPHMGWNGIEKTSSDLLFEGLNDPRYYFLHSFIFVPDSPECVLSYSNYQVRFASSVRKGNVWATQFHPEKSHVWGVRLLQNFASVPLC